MRKNGCKNKRLPQRDLTDGTVLTELVVRYHRCRCPVTLAETQTGLARSHCCV